MKVNNILSYLILFIKMKSESKQKMYKLRNNEHLSFGRRAHSLIQIRRTGIPKKNETEETIVRNLFSLYSQFPATINLNHYISH